MVILSQTSLHFTIAEYTAIREEHPVCGLESAVTVKLRKMDWTEKAKY